MKTSLRLFSIALLLTLSGCSLFRDDRPAPQGSPYAVSKPPKTSEKLCSGAEAVNAAATAISVRMSFSSLAPFRVVPVEGKLSPLGRKVHESLIQMGLSRAGAAHSLLMEDRQNGNEWTVVLCRQTPGTQPEVFFSKTYLLKGEKQP